MGAARSKMRQRALCWVRGVYESFLVWKVKANGAATRWHMSVVAACHNVACCGAQRRCRSSLCAVPAQLSLTPRKT